MTDRSLSAALADLAIEFPEVPDLEAAFARLAAPPQRRPAVRLRWAVAAVIVAVAALMTFVTPVREAIADWLGIGAVRIVEVEEIPTDIEESIGDLGIQLGPEAFIIGPDDPITDIIGAPNRTYTRTVGRRITEISFVWFPKEGLPEVDSTGAGALLTRFDGLLDGPVIEKSVGEGTSVQMVSIGESRGYWIEGDAHTFGYLDRDGEVVFETLRLAGNTLLWEEGGFSYRLESGLDMEAAIRVAESLEQ